MAYMPIDFRRGVAGMAPRRVRDDDDAIVEKGRQRDGALFSSLTILAPLPLMLPASLAAPIRSRRHRHAA